MGGSLFSLETSQTGPMKLEHLLRPTLSFESWFGLPLRASTRLPDGSVSAFSFESWFGLPLTISNFIRSSFICHGRYARYKPSSSVNFSKNAQIFGC